MFVKAVSLLASYVMLVQGIAFALDPDDIGVRSTLAPPLRTAAFVDVVEGEDGGRDIVDLDPGKTSVENIRNEWIQDTIRRCISRGLENNTPRDVLLGNLGRELREFNEGYPGGYDIANISEIRSLPSSRGRPGEIKGYTIPFKPGGKYLCDMGYSFSPPKIGQKGYTGGYVLEISYGDTQTVFEFAIDHSLGRERLCDHDDSEIIGLAENIVRQAGISTDIGRAEAVADWVASHIEYAIGRGGYWDARASDTLQYGKGMCFNISNIYIALMRALGIEAEFGTVQIKKEAFKNMVPPERYEKMSALSEHVFVRVNVDGEWKIVDLVVNGREKPFLRNEHSLSPFALPDTLSYRANIDSLAYSKARKDTRSDRDRYEDERTGKIISGDREPIQSELSAKDHADTALTEDIRDYASTIADLFNTAMSNEYGENYVEVYCYGAAHVLKNIMEKKFSHKGVVFEVYENDYIDESLGELRWVKARLPGGKKLMICGAVEKGKILVWEHDEGIEANALDRYSGHDPDSEGVVYDHSRIDKVLGQINSIKNKGWGAFPALGKFYCFASTLRFGIDEISRINGFTIHPPGAVMNEGGLLYCNVLFVKDPVSGIGVSSHFSFINMAPIGMQDPDVSDITEAFREMVDKMVFLGADRDSLQFAVVRRSFPDAGFEYVEKDSLYNHSIALRALSDIGYDAVKITLTSDNVSCDLVSGDIFDAAKKAGSISGSAPETREKDISTRKGVPGYPIYNFLKNDPARGIDRRFIEGHKEKEFIEKILIEISIANESIRHLCSPGSDKNAAEMVVELSEKAVYGLLRSKDVTSLIEGRSRAIKEDLSAEYVVRRELYNIAILVFLYHNDLDGLYELIKTRPLSFEKRDYFLEPLHMAFLEHLSTRNEDDVLRLTDLTGEQPWKKGRWNRQISSSELLNFLRLRELSPQGVLKPKKLKDMVKKTLEKESFSREWTPIIEADEGKFIAMAVWYYMKLSGHEMRFFSMDRLLENVFVEKHSKRLFFRKTYSGDPGEKVFTYHPDNNDPLREFAAYMLGREIGVNVSEVSIGERGEIYSLLPVSAEVSELPQKTLKQAHSANFVFNILIRKWDDSIDMIQRSPIEGTFMSFDNDVAFDNNYLDIKSFFEVFQDFARPRGQIWSYDQFDKSAVCKAAIAAARLDIDLVIENIKEHKGSIPFERLEHIKGFLKETQKNIFEDVIEFYELLTKKPFFTPGTHIVFDTGTGGEKWVYAASDPGHISEKENIVSAFIEYARVYAGVEIIPVATEKGFPEREDIRSFRVVATGIKGEYNLSCVADIFGQLLDDMSERGLEQARKDLSTHILSLYPDTTLSGTGSMEAVIEDTRLFDPRDGRYQKEIVHALNFAGITEEALRHYGEKPVIVAVGKQWLMGYEELNSDQYNALNPLLSDMRRYLERLGITFILEDDDLLAGSIGRELSRIGDQEDVRVVALTAVCPEKGGIHPGLEDISVRANMTVVGIDTRHMNGSSYIRIMEMLFMAFSISVGNELRQKDHEHIRIVPPDNAAGRPVFIFVPSASEMSPEELRFIYSIQLYA